MQTRATPTTALCGTLARLDPVLLRWLEIARRAGRCPDGPQLRAAHEAPGPLLRVAVHGAGAGLEVTLCANQWPELMPLLQMHDTERRDAATRLLLAGAMARITNSGWPVDDVSALARFDSDAHPIGGRVALRVGAYDVDLVPHENAAPFARALEAALAVRAPAATPRLMQWPLKTCIALGARRMARARFAALRYGDAVFGGLGGRMALHIASAASPTWQAGAHLDNHESITMTEQFHPPLDEMPPADEPTVRATVAALAQLPLEIRYEIDGPRLNVMQAAELAAGDVLTLPVRADQAVVHLRCQGRVIARGELVNVGGQLGVRITETGEGAWSA